LIKIKEARPGRSQAADAENQDWRRPVTTYEIIILVGIVAAFAAFAASLAAVSWRG